MKPIYVVQPSLPPYEEFIEEIKDLWDSRILTHYGPKHQALEKKLVDYLKVGNVEIFVNGHMALEAIFNQYPKGSEVITTPYTYASTTQAMVRAGLVPVFCDIEPDWLTLDPTKIEALITDKTKLIAPVHVYGNVCRYKEIDEVAKKHGLDVVYDAAHAFGVFADGTSVAAIGTAAMFSFHATKVFNTVEGGCLTFGNDALRTPIEAWRMYGMQGKENASLVGTNAKMTEMHAAMGLCNLKYVDREIGIREQIAKTYRRELEGVEGVKICPVQEGVRSNYAYFPVLFTKDETTAVRDAVADHLGQLNIFPRKYFYPITSEFDAYKGMFEIQPTPIASVASNQVLTLPLHTGLTVEDAKYICDEIKKVL